MQSKKTFKRWAIVAGSVLVVGALAWGVHRSGADRRLLGPPRVAPANASATWQEGERRTYAVDLKSSITMEVDKKLLGVSLTGKWTLEALSVRYDTVALASTLTIDRFETESASDAKPDMESVKRDFAKPFFFTLDGSGKIIESRADAATSGLVEGIVRSIAGSAQFQVPAFAQDRLEATETDSSGRYTARYERQPDGSYLKSKLAYLEVRPALGAAAGMTVDVQILESRTKFVFEGTRLQNLALSERVDVKGSDLPTMRSETALTLARTATEPRLVSGRLLAATAKGLTPLPLSARVSTEAELGRLHAQQAREYDVGKIAGALAGLTPDEEQVRAKLYGRAKDLLKADPSAVADAVSQIRKNPEQRVFWISALGQAGTPTAQNALIDVYREPSFDANTRRDTVRALSLVDEHTPATVAMLESLAGDPLMGRQARYGLGTAANHLHGHEPERANEILAGLQSGLATAETEADRVTYIKALGNAGNQDAIDLLEEQLKNSSGAVRTQAMRALRLMPEGRADQILATEMVSDYDSRVRMAAVEATRRRNPTEVVGQALLELLKLETVPMARQEVYATLLAWGPEAPYVGEALEWARKNEKDPELRKRLPSAT